MQNLIKSEPDRKRRNALAQAIDACIDRHLAAANPDQRPSLIYEDVCAELELYPEPRTLSDELLGIKPAYLIPRPDPPGW